MGLKYNGIDIILPGMAKIYAGTELIYQKIETPL